MDLSSSFSLSLSRSLSLSNLRSCIAAWAEHMACADCIQAFRQRSLWQNAAEDNLETFREWQTTNVFSSLLFFAPEPKSSLASLGSSIELGGQIIMGIDSGLNWEVELMTWQHTRSLLLYIPSHGCLCIPAVGLAVDSHCWVVCTFPLLGCLSIPVGLSVHSC